MKCLPSSSDSRLFLGDFLIVGFWKSRCSDIAGCKVRGFKVTLARMFSQPRRLSRMIRLLCVCGSREEDRAASAQALSCFNLFVSEPWKSV